MHRRTISLIISIFFTFLLVGCSGAANQAATETEASNQTQAVEDQAQTEEARSIEETQAAEDSAATAEAVSEMETQTAIEEATAAAHAKATAAKEALNAAGTQKAEDVLAGIDEILQSVGHSTESGKLGWIQDEPFSVSFTSGAGGRFSDVGGDKSYSDFVLYYNVTWETSGVAGCSSMVRSEKDLKFGQQYRFNTLRFSGAPAWDVELYEFGQIQSNITGGLKYTSLIDLDNGATNNYILVAEGSTMTVYVNGKRVSGVTIATRSEGYFGFFAWQQDGQTKCTFKDAWVWELP